MIEWLKAFGEFLDKVDARFKSLREEMRNEMKLEVREVVEGHVAKMVPARVEKAEAPVGIDTAYVDEVGMLVLRLSDGTTRTAGRAVGPAGKDAVGIASVEVVSGELVVGLSDGAIKNLGRIVGQQGDPGEPDEDAVRRFVAEVVRELPAPQPGKDGVGISSAEIVNGELLLGFTDGAIKKLGRVVGPAGDAPEPKEPSEDVVRRVVTDVVRGMELPPPKPGRDGLGVSDLWVRGNELVVRLTDGNEKNLGRVVGRDGKDGITTEQLDAAIAKGVADTLAAIEFDGRTWKIGDRVVRTPAPQYKGVWSEGSEYVPGDMATYGGSLWHCNAASTEKPGDGSKAWTLAAKRGRDAAR